MSTVSCSGRLFSLGLAPTFFFFLAGEGEGCEPLAVAFVGDSDEDSSEDSDDEGGTFRFSGEVSFEAKGEVFFAPSPFLVKNFIMIKA